MTVSFVAKKGGVSMLSAKREIRALLKMGVLKKMKSARSSAPKGKRRTEDLYALDDESKNARALAAFVREISPAEFANVERILRGSGRFFAVVLSGVFVGDPSRPADLLIAWDSINERKLERAVRDLETLWGSEIRYAAFPTSEFRYRLTVQDRLIRDTFEYPHQVLFSKISLYSPIHMKAHSAAPLPAQVLS